MDGLENRMKLIHERIIRLLRNRIDPALFTPVTAADTHYVQLGEEDLKRELPKIEDILVELDYTEKYVDLAYVSGRGIRRREYHSDKAEVYFMLTDAKIWLDDERQDPAKARTYDVHKGDVLNIPAGVEHWVKPGNAQYLMANIRDTQPPNIASKQLGQ